MPLSPKTPPNGRIATKNIFSFLGIKTPNGASNKIHLKPLPLRIDITKSPPMLFIIVKSKSFFIKSLFLILTQFQLIINIKRKEYIEVKIHPR